MITTGAILATLVLTFAPARSTVAIDTQPAHEDIVVRFLDAFAAYDYEACRSLLTPDATIASTRRYRNGPYAHVHQTTDEWLKSVRESGVTALEDFSIDVHETTSVVHEHGATVIVRFTSSGRANGRVFQGLGIDTANLIETPDGWRILHYSSFEDFQWSDSSGGDD